MKYLVTGGAGFIGSHLVRRLIADGHHVHVFDNLSSGFREYLPWKYGDEEFESERFKFNCEDIQDLLFHAELMEEAKFDGVFHVAGFARIQPSIENPLECNDTNVIGTLMVLEFMKKLGINNIVYSASSSSYGLKAKLPCTEDQPPDCLTPYAYSKYAGELACKAWGSTYGIRNACVKYFNVYGERSPEQGSYAPVIGLFFRQALLDSTDLTVVGDGEQKRDFTFIDDVVEANLKAMEALQTNPDNVSGLTFNVGCGKNYTINEVADMVLKTLQKDNLSKDLKVVHIPARIGESRETLASVELAKKLLSWEPKVSLEEGIEKLKSYYINKFTNQY
jgi:UDP-glucose 4-epimerase